MSDELDDQYLEWIYTMVGRQAENVDHWKLMDLLLSREFVMIVPNDDNRCMDGLAIRNEFVRTGADARPSRAWLSMGCSVLEMLVGVARHLSFEMDGEVGEWFWHLVNNLGLSRYDDKRWNARWVEQVVERLVWRQYSYDGNGGLFPLQQPHEDQRQVELWFQMEAYMLEMS